MSSSAFALIFLAACAGAPTEPAESTITMPTTVRTHESRPPAETAVSTTACEGGDLRACHAAALDAYYAPPTPESDARAVALFQRACDAGYAPSCNGLGTMHDQGRGVREDHAAAVALFRRSCETDGSTGCQHLAQALRTGRGIAKNEAAAQRAEARGSCLFEASLAKTAAPCPALLTP